MTNIPLLVGASTLIAALAIADESGFSGRAAETVVRVGDAHETYGAGSLTAHQVGSFEFQSRSAATPISTANGVERFMATASAFAVATPMLPNGAQIERLELRGCDTDAGSTITVNFGTCPVPGGACAPAGTINTGTAATPGCANFSTDLAVPVIVDNQAQVLSVEITTGTTAGTTFSAVKLYYRLRVSPPPATATFPNDVPTTHGFFRFVEALAAAGITGGCGAGSFCPNAPVTRGEIAVFLSVALGLHFPN
jgi:S-layer homology domain